MKKIWFAGILLIVAWSCSTTHPYKASNKKYKKQAADMSRILRSQPHTPLLSDSMKQPQKWVGTVNFGLRKPSYVIIHHTAQESCEKTLQTFTQSKSQVSAHYVICKDGTLHHQLNDYLRAWHAGKSRWGNEQDINSASIGIEIDNNGKDTFTLAQMDVLMSLLAHLKKTYSIPAANFIGHSDIAPRRKVDPNVHFPWKQLADSGYGKWWGDTSKTIVSAGFEPKMALRIIGYNISDEAAATEAFRRHFTGVNAPGPLSDAEKKILYSLMEKFL